MSYVATQVYSNNPTAQPATGPIKAIFSWATGESASGTAMNKMLVPNALTRSVMAETDAGANVVNCVDLDDLFKKIDS
jgi:quinol-cytochrome oxidoreductase complex cytochrome b subunit